MPEFLQYGFMHRAFAAGVVTALICPAIGVFLIPRRLSLIADTLAHVALAGVALGLVLGISPVVGALVVVLAGAVGMERLRARGALQGDAALAVFLSGGFALAVVLISLARGFNADLFAILFGSILTVSAADVWLISALGAVVLTALLLFALASLARRVSWGPRARLAAVTLLCLGIVGGASADEGGCRRWRTAFATMPVRMLTLQMGAKTIAVRVKVAETSEQGAAGFQCSTAQEIQQTLILFDFGQEIYTQFHMQNVPAALYGPMGNFRFALEARAGFYESQGVRPGEARLLIPAAK